MSNALLQLSYLILAVAATDLNFTSGVRFKSMVSKKPYLSYYENCKAIIFSGLNWPG